MSSEIMGLIGLTTLFAFIFLQVPVGIAMGLSGVITVGLLIGFDPAFHLVGIETFFSLASPDLALIVLFVLMGNLAGTAGLSSDLYRLAHAFLGHLRGGLAMATIGASAGFGAICGSSLATTATLTRMALPEMRERGYADQLATGSIAAGATLGIIVPPSIVLVLYGLLTEQSIQALFIAALIPAAIAALFYLVTIYVVVSRKPELAPQTDAQSKAERLTAIRNAIGFLILASAVSGGIYSGVITVNEAASVGVTIALFLAWKRRKLSRESVRACLFDTAETTSMIYLVLIGASIFSYAITLSDLPQTLVNSIEQSGLPPLVIIFLLQIMYIILGSIFDTVAAMVITLPFVFPLIIALGFDPVWWGVINVIVMEIGMLTPPIGLNVFVVHGLVPDVPMRRIFGGVLPFVISDFARLILLTLFPMLMIL